MRGMVVGEGGRSSGVLLYMDFFYSSHEMPTLMLCGLFHHDRGWENESSFGRIGEYIFCQCWVKGHHTNFFFFLKFGTVASLMDVNKLLP